MADKYWWEEDEEKKKQENQSESQGYWWDDGNLATQVGTNISNRVNTWLNNHNNYVSNYQTRYKDRKYTLDDAYVKDSASWVDTISKQKSNFDAEAESILSYMEQYSSYLDGDWMKSVRDTLSGASSQQSAILENSSKDHEWWSNFGSDQELLKKYGSAEGVYNYLQRSDRYNKKYTGQTYSDLAAKLDTMEEGEEKDWLKSYAASVDYDEKMSYDVASAQKEIDEMESIYNKVQSLSSNIGMGGQESDDYLQNQINKIIVGYSKGEYYGIADLEKAISKKKQKLDQAKFVQDYASWSSVAGRDDFEEKSQYVNNFEYGLFGKPEFTDDTYAYVNNPTVEDKRPLGAGNISARSLIDYNDAIYKADTPGRNSDSSQARDALEQISEDEVKVYNYYYATEGKEKAQEYLDFLVSTFKERKDQQIYQDASQYANEHPVLSSIGSVATSLGSGFEYVGDAIRYGGDKLFGDENAKLDTNQSALYTNAIRGTVAEKVDWEIGNWDAFDFVYNTTMSGIDSATSMVFGGGAGVVLGLSAAAQGTNDALNRGMSDGQAFWNGIFSGAFECLFESISIGNFKKLKELAPSNVKEIFKNLGKSMLVNASEETLTEIANIGYDTLVNGEFANYTIEELENGAWKQALAQVIEAGASGAFMGLGMGSAGNAIGHYNGYAQRYGESTDALIQEGLESDPNSRSYKLAQKYQKLTEGDNGKSLSGFQIKNLVKANEAQFKVEDYNEALPKAQERLTELGETENADEVAKLVAKRVSGQKLTKAEKSTLAKSQYGAKVAKELQDSAKENEITYKPLTERVGEESRYNVSKNGQTTLRNVEGDGEAIKIKEVTKIEDGQLYVKLEDGREEYAGDIDFANDSESVLYSAIADMENITPAAATALIKNFDPASEKSVGEYVNGVDEAYTYGYNGYSVEDLKVGDHAVHLSNEQMMSAYKLGQSARAISNETHDAPLVQMRTAKQAAISKNQASQQLKAQFASNDAEVYFMDGANVTKFDETGHKYDEKRMAGVNAAKFLSKLGIGRKYYFYESYVNADGVRVYKDSNGVEKKAPNGMYKSSDGSIYIDLNAGNKGEGTTLFTLGHELTHFVKAYSEKQFKSLSDLVTEAFRDTDMDMNQRVLKKQKNLSDARGEKVSYSEAFEEVVADAMSTMLTDGNLYEKLTQLKAKDKGLFNTIKKFFEDLIAKFKKLYAKLEPDQQDAQDIRQMKEMFDKIQTAFAEALVEASENSQVLAQAGIAVNDKTDSGSLESVRDVLNEADRNKVAKALAERFDVTVEEAKKWLKAETSLASLILNPKYSQFLDYEADPNELAIKQNSDYPQGTVDFSNICKKRREFTQVMNSVLRNFPNHVFAATDLAKIRTIMGEEGMTLPCGICYVEDRRQLDTIVAQDFINGLKLYRDGSKTRPDGKPFNANQLKGLQLTDGDTYVPSIYELVSLEGRNSLKAKNPNMEAAWVKYNNARGMQAVRLLTNEAEYKRQILKYNKGTVKSKNDHGGLRIYSFSDAEMFHLIDIIQVITDSATVGLCLQGYTKVNEYAKAVKDTGEKLNRSLIPKGKLGYHMENGNVVLDYDTVEGIDIYSKDFFDNKDNPNVGNIVIGINDVQIRAAMRSDFIDQIIPFHTGQSEEVLGEKGIAEWDNYKDYQTEKDLETGKTSSHQVNIYTEVFQAAEKEGKPIQNKRQFVEKFLQVCKENNLQPRFSQFLNVDSDGNYVYTEGYHKFLVDFKTFAQTDVGEYLPQMPVKPIFEDAYITGLLENYVTEQKAKDAEVAKQMPKVIERITNEIVKPGEIPKVNKNSDRNSDRDSTDAQNEKFSMRETVEETKDLLAYHNISAKLLLEVLNRNSLLMPSVAITNMVMTDFGEISLLFDKSSIDPNANEQNKLYGADAWTPNQIELKKNAKFDTDKTVNAVNGIKDRIGSKYVADLFNITAKQFRDAIIKKDGSIYDAFAHNIGMQTAYALENGIISEIPTNENGTVNKAALESSLREALANNGWRPYKAWLNNISDTVIKSYDKATNEDIIKNMKAQPATAKTFKLTENGKLIVPAKEYTNIDEARKNKNRLSENAEEATKAVANEFLTLAQKIGGNTKAVVNAINAAFADRYSTADIVRTFDSQGVKISSEIAGELQALYKRAVELPTEYFEAKPHREVGLNEVKAVVMPAGTEYAKLKSKLEEQGISVVEYKAGSKKARVEALNSMEDLKFSERNFTYKELTAKSDLNGRVIKANRTVKMTSDGSIDKEWVISEVLSQCESIQTKSTTPTYYVNIPDIGKNVQITSRGIGHGFIKFQTNGGKAVPQRSLINARAALDLPQILRNSIEVNRSERGDNSEVEFSHVLIGVTAMEDSNGSIEYYAVRSVVEARKNQGAVLTEANVIGKLHAINAKKIGKPNAKVGANSPVARANSSLFGYSVADLLNDVKNEFNDTFSNDVYKHFGMTRKGNKFSTHLKYSDRDSTGKQLTKEQIEFFNRSKVRDAEGNLLKVYHTTPNANFTVFDPSYSDDKLSLFFTDNIDMSRSYDGSSVFNVGFGMKVNTMDNTAPIVDANNLPGRKIFNFKNRDGFWVSDTSKINEALDYFGIKYSLENGKYTIPEFDSSFNDGRYTYTTYFKSKDPYEVSMRLSGYQDSKSYSWEGTGWKKRMINPYKGTYACYLNIENPLEVDAEGSKWSEIPYDGKKFTTRDLAKIAKRNRNDGVIIRNVLDNGSGASSTSTPSTVTIAFNSNQVKSVDNTSPTDNDDIRYSDRDFPNNAEDIAKEYFGTTKKWSETGWLLQDGTQLDFSGRHWERDPENEIDLGESYYSGKRNMEHYEIAEAFPELRELSKMEYRGEHLDKFMNRGNIRIVGKGSIGLETMPTEKQFEKLRGYFRENIDKVIIVGIGRDSLTYIEGTYPATIIEGIRDYFSNNRRNQSELMKFHTMYSERTGDSVSNRSLLANAFEGLSQNSNEYKMIQEYKNRINLLNEQEEKLSKLNAEIRKIRFGTEGARDTAKLRRLEAEAKNTAESINRHDKKLLSMEASEPLRKVIDRERKKEAQKTKEYVKEIQQNKKVRAEQTELRHKIRKAVRDLDKILNRGNKKLNVKEDMQNVVTKALKAADILFTDNYGTYDMLRNGIGTDLSDSEEALVDTCTKMLKDIDKMPTEGYESWLARQEAEERLKVKMSKLKDVFARERKRLNNTTVSSILGELAEAYASLEKSEQSYVQGAYTEAVHNFLKSLQSEVGGTIVKDMTKSQLESVYAAYQMVLNTVRNANKMFNEALKQSRAELGNAVIQEVINAGGTHGLWTKGEIARSQASWNNMKPVWVANRIGSDTFGKLMNGLFKGQYNFAVDVDEAKQFKLEMDNKYHPRNWDADKLHSFESSTGKKFSLNLQQIMSLYAFSKREQSYSHLLNGGFVYEANSTVVVDQKGIKRTYLHDGATSYKLSEANLNEIINTLSAEQKAYVDEMQKYLSDVMGAKGNEVSMKLYGIQLFKEKFYFPLRSSGAYMEKAKEAEMKKQQGQINIVNSGFTHAVKPEAKNPIILSGFMDVWAEHCNEMSMYHSMVLPMEDFRKVYNYSTVHDEKLDSASVYQTIQDAYGNAATSYLDQLYRELNAGATVDPRETPFKARISKFKKAAVMLSASVVVQQFSSIGRAYAVIDPKYFIGTKVNSGTQMSVADEMKKYAPVAIIKEMGGFDTGTKGSAKNYIMAEQYGKGERIKGLVKDEQYRGDIMSYLPAKADEITWCTIWEAVKRETKAKHSNMDVKSEAFLKLAGERFSGIIEKTQVYDSVLARSANMRSKGAFMSMATAFMAEPTTTINLIEDALRGRSGKNIARAFGAVAASIVLNNALSSLIYAMRDDDDDETLIEKYFQSFASSMVDDINPMTYYPFLKDIYSLFQGYDVERADMSVIADLRDALKKAISVIGKDTSNMDEDALAEHYKNVGGVLMSILDAGCSAFGVPVKNVRRDVNGIINAYKTISTDISERDTTWNSFWDKVGSAVKDTIPIYAWTKDKSKADKLYDAIISGDKEYLARIKSTYKDEDAYNSAVSKVLRENDPRIHQAAMAKYQGNTAAYKTIFRKIQSEGKFSFDDIMNAINSDLSKIKGDTEPKSETSDYSSTDFVNAILLGETRAAEAMRDDIISTKIANGKTQDEAEKSFADSIATAAHNAFDTGLLDEAGTEKMLVEYAGKDEEEAAAKVGYWAFCKAHPQYEISEEKVAKYHEFAEPADISLDVFVQFLDGTNGLKTIRDEWGDEVKSKREQVLEVIDSLPLTWQQKDALYLAYGYSESTILDVPW